MKVIDLLNKIANGEEVPKKIKYNDFYFNWTGLNYYCGYEDMFLEKIICIEDLNYSIEIIEEDKEIEKLFHCFTETNNQEIKFCIQNINDLADKVNELIKAVNELKKGK